MDKSNYRNMWVHVEHDGEKIHPVTLELCSEIRKLCDQSGDKLIAVSAGELPAVSYTHLTLPTIRLV